MSSWATQSSSPRTARQARAQSIIAGTSTSEQPNKSSSIFPWLQGEDADSKVKKQITSARKSPLDSLSSLPPSNKSSSSTISSSRNSSFADSNKMKGKKPSRQPQASSDDDFIMVDMLDGGHLATKRPSTPILEQMLTENLDSIISLPPVETSVPDTWHSLRKAEAQEMRRSGYRVTNSAGPAFYRRTNNSQYLPPPPGLPPHQHSNIVHSTSSNYPPLPPPSTAPVRARQRSSEADSTAFKHTQIASVQNQYQHQQQPKRLHQHEQPPQPPITVAQLADLTRQQHQHTHRRVKSGSASWIPAEGLAHSASAGSLHGMDFPYPDEPSNQSSNHGQHRLRANPSTHFQSDIPIEANTSTPLRSSHIGQLRQDSEKGHQRVSSYKWFDEDTNSYAPSSLPPPIYPENYTQYQLPHGGRRKRRMRPEFQPNQWGWKRPAEEDAIMPSGAWIYLMLIGAITFGTAFLVNTVSDGISNFVFFPISNVLGSIYGSTIYTLTLALLRGLSLASSFAIVLNLSPHYGAGSGIPEMKCVLGGVLMPQMLNWQTLVGKMTGLIFSLASGISIGRLGPFIHMSCISAALVSKLSIFPALRSNTRFQLQALSAAMAAGVGATFGAPIGGTMLAVEIMSTYYYIHWIPMALYCSIMGYYFLFIVTKDTPSYFTAGRVDLQGASSVERLFSFCVLGGLCGAIGALLVHFTKKLLKYRQRFFKNAFPWRTGVMLFLFAIVHTFISSYIGGVLGLGQRSGIDQLFLVEKKKADFWFPHAIEIFGIDGLDTSLALIVIMVVKFVLSAFSFVLPVPAGVFTPIFLIGALFGRAFGETWCLIPWFNWLDPTGAAIVGAAAMTAGSLHTVSVAVVMLELTREAIDVLPLAIGVIVSYAVSKRLCSDLFSELIKVRKLPYILGLRERYPWETKQFYEDVSAEEAGSFMNKDFAFVTPTSTRSEIWDMLNNNGRKPWSSCAFLSDNENRRLWGTISQQTLWEIVMEDIHVNLDYDNKSGKFISEPEYGTFNASESGTLRGFQTIPFLRNFNPQLGHPLIDMGPMQMSVKTPFWKVITFFQMLSMGQMYVLDDGVTVGCISKADVISHSIMLEESSQMKRKKEEASISRRKRLGSNAGKRRPIGSDLPDAFKYERRGGSSHSRNGSLALQSRTRR